MDLIKEIVERAKANKQRIVLPEGTEERTIKAADQLLGDGVADIILIGNVKEVKEGSLSNIAPTILKLMNLEIPSQMDKPLI